jgi:hypothetical protein
MAFKRDARPRAQISRATTDAFKRGRRSPNRLHVWTDELQHEALLDISQLHVLHVVQQPQGTWPQAAAADGYRAPDGRSP